MRRAAIIFLALMLIILGIEISSLQKSSVSARAKYEEGRQELNRVKGESEKTQADLNYFLNPSNLEKELRARFNYRKPGENLIILVPSSSSTPR